MNLAFAAVLGLVVVSLGLALIGVGNPHPIGTLAWEETPGLYTLDAPRECLTLEASRRFDPPGTLELTAHQESGPHEAAYGLWWREVRVALNSNGYLGVWLAEEPIYAWQPFPHVRGAGEPNRLRLDVDEGHLVVFVNDEFVIEGDIETAFRGDAVGAYMETFGHGGVTIHFERLRMWEK